LLCGSALRFGVGVCGALCYDAGMKRLILFLLLAASARAQFAVDEMLKPCVYTNGAGVTLPYRLSAPQFPAAGRKYPLVLFLHGSGECGTDNTRQIKIGLPALMSTLLKRPAAEPVLIVAPQCPVTNWFVRGLAFKENYAMSADPAQSMAMTLELVRHLVAERQADPDRLYITGLSLGGFGTWDAIQREPDLFAAAVPICGGGDIRRVRELRGLPVWVFHGTADKNVPIACSRRMVDALKRIGNRKVHFTVYEEAGHDVWDRAYGTPEMIEWLFQQSRAKKPWWKFW
jgi:predicted peptidase